MHLSGADDHERATVGLPRFAPPSPLARRYAADPPRTQEIIAVMRCCGERPHGLRARGLIVVLWRAGLRIQEALDLTELDLDPRRGSVVVRRGKGGHRREVGMAHWAFEQIEPWLKVRESMAVGALFCVITGRGRGTAWPQSAARAHLRRRAGVRRRFVPHQLRHAHALERTHEGVPLNVIQRQLGHRNFVVTSIYLQGIDPDEIIETVHGRRQPMIPASAGLALPRAPASRSSRSLLRREGAQSASRPDRGSAWAPVDWGIGTIVWLALEIVVPVVIGVGAFYAFMRARRTPDEARRATARFAAMWVPAAVVIVVAAAVL